MRITFVLLILALFICDALGRLKTSIAEEKELHEFAVNNSAAFKCFGQYDDLNNGFLEELVEDHVWFTNIFEDDEYFDICSQITSIWDEINPNLNNNVSSIIKKQSYDDHALYGINIDIINKIKTFFGGYDYLRDENVKTDMAFHALRWLTQRKQKHNKVEKFCNDFRTDILKDALIDLTDKCILKKDVESPGRIDPMTVCENALKSHVAFALEITIQIGVLLHFTGGIGLYAQFQAITDVYIYDTFGLGILIDIEFGLFIGYINFKDSYTGSDYMHATGKWTLGIEAVIGGTYSWIRKDHKTIASEINFALAVGIQLVDYVWYIDNKVIKEIANFNFTQLCQKLTNFPTKNPTPAGPPTLQPYSGEIDLFSSSYENWWTPINGNWSNFTGRPKVSISNYDSIGKLDTNWIGANQTATRQWQNYTVIVALKILDNTADPPSSIGFFFGAYNVNESYYFGIYSGNVIFGIFSSNGAFQLIDTWQQPVVKVNKAVTLSATFVVDTTSTAFILLQLNDYQLAKYSNFTRIRGSMGMRTIGKNGTFTSFKVRFNSSVIWNNYYLEY